MSAKPALNAAIAILAFVIALNVAVTMIGPLVPYLIGGGATYLIGKQLRKHKQNGDSNG